MSLKDRIDNLNRKCDIGSYVELLTRIYRKLDYPNPQEKALKEKSNFSQMLMEKRPIKKEFYIPMEQIYHVSMNYILYGKGTGKVNYKNGGLRYTASTNDYKMFELLGTETYGEDSLVIFNSDEYNKTIFDYIVEFDATEGLRYLADKYSIKYVLFQNSITSNVFQCFCTGETLEKIFEMVVSKDEASIYNSVFDSYQLLSNYYGDNSIYHNRNCLTKILDSEKIFESILTTKEFPLNVINIGLQLEDDKKSLFMNPLVNMLFALALEDPSKYKDKIEKIINFGISKNKEIIDYVVSHYDNGLDSFRVDENGTIFLGHTKYGLVLNPGDVINPSLEYRYRRKIEDLRQINEGICYRDVKDFFGNNHKKIKHNEKGHVLKLASGNELEYAFHEKYESSLPIPKYYGSKNGVDEFEEYRGNLVGHYISMNINHLTEIGKFLKSLHDLTIINNGDVYVHGDISLDNFYFSDGKLTDVVNWDNVHIGNIYEDMISLIINYSGMNDRYRDNLNVIDNIKKIFDSYGASNEFKKNCIEKLKERIDKSISEYASCDFASDRDAIYQYESYLWCKSFVDIYYNQLEK